MNCTYCGKKLYPEAPFCPHCGRPNEHRAALENNVRAFDQSYARTTGEVRNAVRRKNRFIGKIAAIVFLIFGIALATFFREFLSHSLAYDLREKKTAENLDALLAEENAYLDAQDYFGLNAWFAYTGLANDIGNAAPAYYLVTRTAQDYCGVMENFMAYRAALADETPYPEAIVSRADTIRRSLTDYYRSMEQNRTLRQEEPARTDAVAQMTANLEALTTAWFGMPASEAASLSSLSAGAREVLLETWVQAPPETIPLEDDGTEEP